MFKDWWTNNEDYAKYMIKLCQLKLYHIQFDPKEKEKRQRNYVRTLKEYEIEKHKGIEIANNFLGILEKGRKEEVLFEETWKNLDLEQHQNL